MPPPVEYGRTALIGASVVRYESLADLDGLADVALDIDLAFDVSFGDFPESRAHQERNRLRGFEREMNPRRGLGRNCAAVP